MVKIEIGDRDRAKAIFEALYASEPNVRGTKFTDSEIYIFIENLIDQLSTPKFEPEVEPTWHIIPGFENYEISKTEGVRNIFTKKILKIYTASTQHGLTPNVEMHDKDGFRHNVSLAHLNETILGKKDN